MKWKLSVARLRPPCRGQFWVGNEIGVRAREFLGDGKLPPTSPATIASSASRAALNDTESVLLFEVTVGWQCFVAKAGALRRCEALS